MFTGTAIGQIIAAGFILITIGASAGGAMDWQERVEAEGQNEYVDGEIIVKFSKPVSDGLREHLAAGGTIYGLRLSASLDNLTSRYEVTSIKPVIENFYVERQRIEALVARNEADLTYNERRMVRRLKRAPKGVEVPDLGRIYTIDLEPGQSAPDAAAEYNRDADVEYAELNFIVYADSTEPDDPNYPVQWALANTGQDYPAGGGQGCRRERPIAI